MRFSIRQVSLISAMGLFLSFTAWAVCASLCVAGICTEAPKPMPAMHHMHPCCHAMQAKKAAPKCEKCVIQAKIQAQKTASDKSYSKIDLVFPILLLPPVTFSYVALDDGPKLAFDRERCNSPPGGERRPDAPRAPPVS